MIRSNDFISDNKHEGSDEKNALVFLALIRSSGICQFLLLRTSGRLGGGKEL